MAIQIPFHSQASPGRSPDMGGTRQPAGHWPTQQAVYTQTPQDRTRATADMFSGGLQGLQSVADALGGIGKGFYEIAAQQRKTDDFIIKSEIELDKVNTENLVSQFALDNPFDWDLINRYTDEQLTSLRERTLSRSMPQSLRTQIEAETNIYAAKMRRSVLESTTRSRNAHAGKLFDDRVQLAAEMADEEMVDSLIQQAVEDKVLHPESAPIASRRYRNQAQLSKVSSAIGVDPQGTLEALRAGQYDLEPDQRRRLMSEARSFRNFNRAEKQEEIAANLDDFTEERIAKLLEDGEITPQFAEIFREAKVAAEGKLSRGLRSYISNQIRQYNPEDDPEALEYERVTGLLAYASQRDPSAYKALNEMFQKRKGSSKDSAPVAAAKEWLKDLTGDKKPDANTTEYAQDVELKYRMLEAIESKAGSPEVSDIPSMMDWVKNEYSRAYLEIYDKSPSDKKAETGDVKVKKEAPRGSSDSWLQKYMDSSRLNAQDEIAKDNALTSRNALRQSDTGLSMYGASTTVPYTKSAPGETPAAAIPKGRITYETMGKIRDKPLQEGLVNILQSAADSTGYRVAVVSGGQDSKKRTGSHRHDGGHAADVKLYRNGRVLRTTNKKDIPYIVEFLKKAKEAGATGIGAGPGYMGGTAIHIDFASGKTISKGSANYWGAGGKSANAPKWLKDIWK